MILLMILLSFRTGIYAQGIIGEAQGPGLTGVLGRSVSGSGIHGHSDSDVGGYFYGGSGVAVELRGADSPWGAGSDDCVIRTDRTRGSSDMIVVSNDAMHFRLDDDNNSTSEFAVFNGDETKVLTLTESGNMTITGTYSPSSDINRKEKIIPIDPNQILEKVMALTISEWQFIGENIRHSGPMAQDFYASFGLGQGETTISTVDADGIALASIQALKKENDLLREQMLDLKEQMKQLQVRKHKKNRRISE